MYINHPRPKHMKQGSKTTLIYLNTWEFCSYGHVISILKLHPNSTFVFDCSQECDFVDIVKPGFMDIIVQYNIKFFLIVGSSEDTSRFMKKSDSKVANIVYYPTYWLERAYEELTVKNPYLICNASNASKLFICLNNKARRHRCIMMDALQKHQLGDHSYITWNSLSKKNIASGEPYKFEYWTEQFIRTKDSFKNGKNLWLHNDEYLYDSLFDLVTESTTRHMFFTEKTWRPILLKKPFIIYGKVGIHEELMRYGFRLLPEVDYSFDDEPDDKIRAEMISLELKRLSAMNIQKLRERMLDTVELNFGIAKSLIGQHHYTYASLIKHLRSNRFDIDLTHLNENNFMKMAKNITTPYKHYRLKERKKVKKNLV